MKTRPPLKRRPYVCSRPASTVATSLNKSFGAVAASRDLSFDLNPGEIRGLIGPNGAGKTTLLRIINQISAHLVMRGFQCRGIAG